MVRVLDKWEDYEKKTIHYVLSFTCRYCGVYTRTSRVFPMKDDPNRTLRMFFGCGNCHRFVGRLKVDPPLYFVMPSISENRGALVGKIIWVS